MESSSYYTCSVCQTNIVGTISNLFLHFRKAHHLKTSNQAVCDLKCNQNGCQKKFKTFKTFRSHLKCCDKVLRFSTSSNDFEQNAHLNPTCPESNDARCSFDPTVPLPNFEALDIHDESDAIDGESVSKKYKEMIATFMLKLKTEKNCTHSALNSVANFFSELLRDLQEKKTI